jgi:hypothetical protein
MRLGRKTMRGKCRIAHFLSLIVLISVSGAPAVRAQKEKHPPPPPPNQASGISGHVAVDVFIGKDQEMIRRYYVAHPGTLPPGLAKRGGDLPPGLAKQLARNGHLPPGLEKKLAPFPVALEQELAPLKPGLVRGVIEGRAVIYSPKTSVIFDVLVIL